MENTIRGLAIYFSREMAERRREIAKDRRLYPAIADRERLRIQYKLSGAVEAMLFAGMFDGKDTYSKLNNYIRKMCG